MSTKRFLQVDSYIRRIKNERKRNYAIHYYHSLLNGRKLKAPEDLSMIATGKITEEINNIMYQL